MNLDLDLSESRVLLVDDTRADLDVLVATLQGSYRISVARDGKGALRSVEQSLPDVVVCDILMPGVDGLVVCREIRGRGDRVPILMLTALDAVDQRIAGLDAGADDYLTKPFDFGELHARLRAIVRRHTEPETTRATVVRKVP